MSYISDPYDLIKPPTLEQSEIDFEEPPSADDVFEEEIIRYYDNVRSEIGVQVQVCRFDEHGNHTQMAKSCPHFDLEDEEGRRVNTGWTVQNLTR